MRPALLLPLAVLLIACGGERAAAPSRGEFLIAAGDSTYWVRVSERGARVRGSPIHLARVDGRFYELYVSEDDRSHPEAVIVGQRLYRRDLLTGDSLLVLEDSTIAAFARWYARNAAQTPPLGPGEEPGEEAHIAAISELSILDQHERWISYEYAASVDAPGAEGWETVTRGVVNLITGERATLAQLFGQGEAQRLRAVGDTLFAGMLDSLIASRDQRAPAALEVIGEFRFDPTAFSLLASDTLPAVEFVLSGRGDRTGGMMVTLDPVTAAEPGWWSTVRSALPDSVARGVLRWSREGRVVSAHPEGGRYHLRFAANGREQGVARVPQPLWRIFWLDSSSDSTTLRALERAFDEAAFYDEEVRTAMNKPSSAPARPGRSSRPVSYSLHETSEIMMPQHANNLGHVFGGVILSMMDRTAAVAAIRHARGTCVTVSVDRVDFRQPIYLGELVIMKSSVNFAGRTSMEVGVRVEAENMLTGVRRHTNSCYLTFVAVDDQGRPVEVPTVEPETPDETRRYAAAQERRRRRLEERTAEGR